jgi:hypothetical protein
MRALRAAAAAPVLAAVLGAVPAETATFLGWITDTECGPNHAPMIAKGGMGNDDAECTRKCVQTGATYGFVDVERKRFYQLDDQGAPAAFAGRRVRILGRLEGDTIYVTRIEAGDSEAK